MTQAVKPPTNVNRMINDLVHGANGAREIVKEQGMPGLFEKYELSPEQRMAFKEPGWKSFGAIGIQPIHQILLALQVSPEARAHLSMANHLDRFEKEVLSQT